MDNDVQGSLVKVGSAWAAVGITSWAEAASFIAFLYSLALLCEWLWKKAIKPLLISRGYMKAPKRRASDKDDD